MPATFGIGDGGDGAPGLISVIIPARNRKDDLEECLTSLYRQDYPDIEIIVIDDASSDGSAGLLSQAPRCVRVITNVTNMGPCGARNQGIAQARGEYIWFLDSDTVVASPSELSTLAGLLKQHPKIGVIGGAAEIDGQGQFAGVMTQCYLPNRMTKGVKAAPREGVGELVPSPVVGTATFLTRARALTADGPFGPYYFYYCEDNDLTIAIASLGLGTVLYTNSSVIHKESLVGTTRGGREFPPQQFRNRDYLCLKYWDGGDFCCCPSSTSCSCSTPAHSAARPTSCVRPAVVTTPKSAGCRSVPRVPHTLSRKLCATL